jgi:uncharacterized protein YcfL
MKTYQLYLLLGAMLIAGCQSSLENSPVNMKKGDAFYASKEYDAAEYYYQKIPKESPLFMQAKVKLDSIALFKKYWTITTVPPEDLTKIALMDHSASMNMSTMKPLHSFVIANNTQRTLSAVTIRFTYYDDTQTEVAQIVSIVDANVQPMKRGVFSRVEPGILTTVFAKSTATVVAAQY